MRGNQKPREETGPGQIKGLHSWKLHSECTEAQKQEQEKLQQNSSHVNTHRLASTHEQLDQVLQVM